MNISDIERILRQAPSPPPPPGLRDRLVNGGAAILSAQAVTKPDALHATVMVPAGRTSDWLQWVRRWWLALAPAGATLVCVGIIAAQQAQIAELRRAANTVSPLPEITTSEADSTGPAGAMQPAPGANAADSEAEIARLRGLVTKFTDEVAVLEARLQKQRSRAAVAPGQDYLSAEELAPLEEARTNALRIQCVNNLKQFGLAAKVWALDNGDMTPPSVLSMSNELSTPKILVCPADTGRQPATDWYAFSMANCSYEYIGQSVPDEDPTRVLARCAIHNNVCLFDGSVQTASPDKLSYRDGKMYFNQIPQSPAMKAAPDKAPSTQQDAREQFRKRYGLPPEQGNP